MSKIQVVRIKRALRRQSRSCSELIVDVNLDAGHETVWRIIRDATEFNYRRMKNKSDFTDTHKRKRVEVAHLHAPWELEWSTVTFTDEI